MNYSIEELVPYRGSMKLIDAVIDHSEKFTICQFKLNDRDIFVEDGRVPKSFLLEYMGQTAFIRDQIVQKEATSEKYKQGFFLGARNVTFCTDSIRSGQTYWIKAEDFLRDRDFVTSKCKITLPEALDEELASGRLTAVLTGKASSLKDVTHE